MAKKQTAVATTTKAVPAVDDPEQRERMLALMAEDAGDGLSGVQQADLAIPFLAVIQTMSPQRKKTSDKYIDGAEEGMLYNSVTNRAYPSVAVIPCGFEKVWIEWRPREDGGGFVGIHPRNSDIVRSTPRDKKGKQVLANGNEIRETSQHYVLVVHDDGTTERAVLTMFSSQLKKSRRWLTMISERRERTPDGRLFTPPAYACTYTLSTVHESNDLGDWFGFTIEPSGVVSDAEVYAQARAFAKSISENQVKVDHSAGGPVDAPVEIVPEGSSGDVF